MANSLNKNLNGKTVLLKKKGLKPEFHAESERTVKVVGGFGASSFTSGSALLVEFPDKETTRVSGFDVEKIID